MLSGLFRVLAKDGLETRTVSTKSGETSVLNITMVKYWTPDDQGNPYYSLTLWGDMADKYVGALGHNQAVYVEGDLTFDTYTKTYTLENGEEKSVVYNTPSFRRFTEFRMVDVHPVPKLGEDTDKESDPIAKAATKAASSKKAVGDDLPF